MSGTNVWLKLRKSKKYNPVPFLLDHHNHLWRLPYSFSLNHTVEEIYENCRTAQATAPRMHRFLQDIKDRLLFAPKDYRVENHLPEKFSFETFIEMSKKKRAFIFIALHGGNGENGTLQEQLENHGLLYNGSNPKTSALCMDKYITGKAIAEMNDKFILTIPKKPITISSLTHKSSSELHNFWSSLQKELSSETFIIKPQRDGCSAGIVRLFSSNDLSTYVHHVNNRTATIPAGSFPHQPFPVEMPYTYEDDFLIEAFVETDDIHIVKNNLLHHAKTGWIELTVGVVEKNGVVHSLNPSITVAEGEVLSVEEKFQGGTGVNITPPLETIISKEDRILIKKYVEKIARVLRIHNYARLDVFFNTNSKLLYLIEVNTLPALTPSTVLYHQALSESPPMYPTEFIEHLIDGSLKTQVDAIG
jgi:D-alanine-D-alanine ligase-like ATP-grasp enzyme